MEFNRKKVLGVQGKEKGFAKQLLEEKGFKEEEIFFERTFRGSRVDILAESNEKKILVECCSCRVDKVRDFLEEENAEVWIIIRDEFSKIYKFYRGPNWKLVEDFKKKREEEVKKISSPLDNI